MNRVQDAPQATVSRTPEVLTEERSSAHPEVTVCIANWNCSELLKKCLLSICEQYQGVNYEVIVVDNASTDGAPDMVASEFPDVILVRNSVNVGFSKANNQAAALARGRYLFFLNNDTELPPHSLVEFVEFSDRHPGIGMVGPRLRGADGNTQISYRARPTLSALLHRISFLRWTGIFRRAYHRYRRDTFSADGIRPVEALMGAAVFLPREIFEASGRWDERYRFGGEDLDLSAQVSRHGPLVYFSDVEVLHYGRVSSRANLGFAAPNVAVGYVHYFRKSGISTPVLIAYKSLVTLDAPLQLLGKTLQGVMRTCIGKREKAGKSFAAAAGIWAFIRHELKQFWKA